MNDFKWGHIRGEIILWGVRWYCKYGISYRSLEEMLEEWGVRVDHTTLYRGKLKQLIKPVRGFKSMKTAYATIKGFEVMHALRKGQAAIFQYGGGIMGEVRLIERQFNVYTA